MLAERVTIFVTISLFVAKEIIVSAEDAEFEPIEVTDDDRDTEECYKQFGEDTYKTHPDIGLTVLEKITRYGYTGEVHKVTTDDGYILTVYRITGSRSSPPSSKKPPVFLNHGLFANGHIWMLQHGSRSLAFKLADNGFDVWIGNSRGTDHSLEHIRLLSNESMYWNFTWDEMGIYDVPSVIEEILKVTGHPKLMYIGHSMGTTQYFVAMSQFPQLNKYIKLAVLYAPVAFLNNTKLFLRNLAPKADQIRAKLDPILGGNIDIRTMVKEQVLGTSMSEVCSWRMVACNACAGAYGLLFGHNPHQTNYTLLPLLLSISPQVVSLKTIAHYAQILTTGRFRKFDYGDEKANQEVYGLGVTSPPEYDLSRVTAPSVFFWSENDIIAVPQDVKETISRLNPVARRGTIRIPIEKWTHNDFVKGIDADKYVYDRTIEMLRKAWDGTAYFFV